MSGFTSEPHDARARPRILDAVMGLFERGRERFEQPEDRTRA